MRNKLITNPIPMLSRVRLSIIIALIVILLVINCYLLFGMRKYNIYRHLIAKTNVTVKKNKIENPPKIRELINANSSPSIDSNTELIYRSKCPDFGKTIKIIIAVVSSPQNTKYRNNIRLTWGSYAVRNDIALVFNIGTPKDKHLIQKIKEEQVLYNDIIIGTFLDIYSNLTLKTTWMLEWVIKYCSKALFLLKVDDDVFINMPLLLDFINKSKIQQSRSIYGRVVSNWHPVRNEKDKYFISSSQYEKDTFPNFTTGPAYVIPTNIVTELYNEALNMEYAKLEDVFYTGMVASRLNIARINIPEFSNKWVDLGDCSLKNTISVHGATGEYINYMWFRINSAEEEVCEKKE